MLKNISYKKKCYLLLAGFVIMGLITYRLAISETLELKTSITHAQEQLALSNNADKEMQQLSQQLESLSSQLNATSTSKGFQNKVIAGITTYCKKNSLEITEVQESWQKEQNGYLIEISPVIVKGNYKNIVEAVYNIEQVDKVFKIESIHFLKKKNLRYRQEYLTACIYFQNIKAV